MHTVYLTAAKDHPSLKQYLSNAQHLDTLFPRACDIRLTEIEGRGSYYWLVFQPDPESPYRVALTPEFEAHKRLTVHVYRDVRSVDVMTEAADVAIWAPAVFIPVTQHMESIDALPVFLVGLATSPNQPGIRSLHERMPEQCCYCCTMTFMIVYVLSRLGAKCLCCCRGPVEEE